MVTKKITFCAVDERYVQVWPHPRPANRFIEDDYKKLSRFHNNNMHDPTVKTCVPFLDSLTAGYIIPLDQDYLIDPIEDDFTMTPANRDQEDVGYHANKQLSESWHKTAGKHTGKFINKWLVKTPPGYSCLFVKPLNRIEPRFDVLSGVVDTDTYVNAIHLPFILNKRDEQFIIKKGTPLVQVIPFKRESWISWSGFYREKLHNITFKNLTSVFIDRYKSLFWRKKSYK